MSHLEKRTAFFITRWTFKESEMRQKTAKSHPLLPQTPQSNNLLLSNLLTWRRSWLKTNLGTSYPTASWSTRAFIITDTIRLTIALHRFISRVHHGAFSIFLYHCNDVQIQIEIQIQTISCFIFLFSKYIIFVLALRILSTFSSSVNKELTGIHTRIRLSAYG